MTINNKEAFEYITNNYLRTIPGESKNPDKNHCGDVSSRKSHTWLFSTAFPLIAGTLGPVASAFSICSIVQPWRQQLIPGGNIQDAPSVADPSWLVIIEAIQLVGLISNFCLLLHMANRVRFNLALPITILGWYTSSICRIVLTVVVARPLKDIGIPEGDIVWSQSFYYGMWAAILYFIDASLLTITVWGAYHAHYAKTLLLTTSQRTLMLQSIMLLLYLLLGAYMYSKIESWHYLDAVYWAVVTLFTVGFGDYYPETDLGRGLLIPFALAGIISLGLVISSVRNLILEEGSRCVTTRIGNRKREKTISKILLSGGSDAFDPIYDDFQAPVTGPHEPRRGEFERRKAEFLLMRRIQAEASTRRRWVAMAISTFSWLVLWLLGAVVFYKAERTHQGWSYFDAFYFCFEAWTTIGYGDLSPVSNAGRSFYVFWSLLALPTMTVLISNASNTVVRIIRDTTVLVGNITILPNDKPFLRNMKRLINKITLGRLFSDQESESSSSITYQDITHRGPIGNMARVHINSQHGVGRSLATRSIPEHLVPSLTVPLNSNFASISTPDVCNCVEEFTTAIEFQLLLVSEIQTVTRHLQESQPHHYSFDEWARYLKLLGEDEHSPETHCRVNIGRSKPDSSQEGSSNGLKWSWVGDQSPLLQYQLESEWILGRLIDKLRESLVSTRRLQLEDWRRLPHRSEWLP